MIERDSVWWADLDPPRGSEPGFRRPVIVVSSNAYNRSRIATVLCVVVTTNTDLAHAPGNVELPDGTAGLTTDSVANVSQVITLDKATLDEPIGQLDADTAERLDAGLRRVLSL